MAQAEIDNSTPAPDGLRSPQDLLYFPTPVTSEEAFQAIGQLRKEARDEIDRLIQFLDTTDNHMELDVQRRPYPKVLQKYQNPDRPSVTWSGRGRQPLWMREHLRKGKRLTTC